MLLILHSHALYWLERVFADLTRHFLCNSMKMEFPGSFNFIFVRVYKIRKPLLLKSSAFESRNKSTSVGD